MNAYMTEGRQPDHGQRFRGGGGLLLLPPGHDGAPGGAVIPGPDEAARLYHHALTCCRPNGHSHADGNNHAVDLSSIN